MRLNIAELSAKFARSRLRVTARSRTRRRVRQATRRPMGPAAGPAGGEGSGNLGPTSPPASHSPDDSETGGVFEESATSVLKRLSAALTHTDTSEFSECNQVAAVQRALRAGAFEETNWLLSLVSRAAPRPITSRSPDRDLYSVVHFINAANEVWSRREAADRAWLRNCGK